MARKSCKVHNVLTPGNKLRKIREEYGVTQERMADIMQVTRSAVAAYMTRPNASPSPEKLRRIAAEFEVPIGWFYDGEDTPLPGGIEVAKRESMTNAEKTMVRGVIALPVWSAAAGFDGDDWSFDETEDQQEVPMFLCGPDPENVRVIRVRGTSMAPRIPYGSQVLAHLQPDLFPGEIGVFMNPSGRMQIKVFDIEDGKPLLRSLNPEFIPISLPDLAQWVTRAGIITIMRPYEEEDYNIEYNAGKVLRARRH